MIFCADIHMSDLRPTSRNDEDWIGTQMCKLIQIAEYALNNEEKEIIIAGDFFHKHADTTILINHVMGYFSKYYNLNFYIIYGNHDLKNHNPNLSFQTSLLTVGYLPNVTVIKKYLRKEIEEKVVDFFAFGEKLVDYEGDIAVIHKFAYKNKPWHDAPESGNYKNVADELESYDLIVCGDNHERFIADYEGQVFLNCGSMSRRTIDQMDFDPHFYVMKGWNIKPIPFEIEKGVFDEKKGKVEKIKDKAIQEVAKNFKKQKKVELDYEVNVDNFCKKNKIDRDVHDFIKENL